MPGPTLASAQALNLTITIYNTLEREKQSFEPLDPERVTMYVCGPTVYSYAHIGNARPAVIFDVLYRLLQRHYPQVIYARNITDVDDKINAAAAEKGVDIESISREIGHWLLSPRSLAPAMTTCGGSRP